MTDDTPKITKGEGEVTPSSSPSNPSYVETTPNLIDKAEAVASRMEAANNKAAENIARMEAAAARIMLSGRSEAGYSPEKKEETPAEYTKRVMSGKV